MAEFSEKFEIGKKKEVKPEDEENKAIKRYIESTSEVQILKSMEEHPEFSLKQIRKEMEISPSQFSRYIETLERLGLIKTEKGKVKEKPFEKMEDLEMIKKIWSETNTKKILDVWEKNPYPLRIREISELSHLSSSTVSEALKILKKLRLVEEREYFTSTIIGPIKETYVERARKKII